MSLKDVVKPRIGFQGQTQAAGTPNEAGVGGFLPLVVNDNSVVFFDALANVNVADFKNYSSIINTTVAGTTISTSSRLGYRWLNRDRSWMLGLNAGYDSRPMATGYAEKGVKVSDQRSVFFQQVAVNAEAVSDTWNVNAFALLPIGETLAKLNNVYTASSLNTYGFDVGYFITPVLNASLGYYYQSGDLGTAEGSGVLGRLAYEMTSGVSAGLSVSYDDAFATRVSADFEVRLGGPKTTALRNDVQQQPVINALLKTPDHRDVRVGEPTDWCVAFAGEQCIIFVDYSRL
ncbi:carbamoyl-phosphate synthase L chain [Pseudomonas sp. HMWF031]|nr:carbamoyl-phosphate synthase L chain [Pseudomonas sp. HMWF031]